MNAEPSTRAQPGHPGLQAVAALDTLSKLAIVCVAFGWFAMKTLVVTLGSLQHYVRFLDMSALIADPTRLFFDADTPVHRVFFALVCLACLAAPLARHFTKSRFAWLGHLAPVALMVACGALLYYRTSGEMFSPPPEASTSLSGTLMHFANDLVHRGGDVVARHVSIGGGTYLALFGALVLAYQGIRHRSTTTSPK